MTLEPATPTVAVHGTVAVPDDAPSGATSAGVGGSAGVHLVRGLFAEVDATGLLSAQAAPALAAWGGLRQHLGPPLGERGSLSLFVGGGGLVREASFGGLAAGVAADLGVGRRMAPRASFTWVGEPGGDDHLLLLSVGLVARLGPLPEAPAPAPVVAAPPPAGLRVEPAPPGTRVWLEHPVCDWVVLDALPERLAALDQPVGAAVFAPGFQPAFVEIAGPTEVTLDEAPPQATLVVVGTPGDRVRVGGAPVRLDADGVAFVKVPEGKVDVTVVGGGRADARRVAAEAGFALWVRTPPPEPWRVRFAQGSSEVDPAARAELSERAALIGDHAMVVQGSYSPEGVEADNRRLADARAEAVRAALVELGVPAERLSVLPAVDPTEGRAPDEQRIATVRVAGSTP